MSRDKQQCPTGCVCVGGQGESDARPSAAWGAVSQSLWLTKCRSQGPALIQMKEGGPGNLHPTVCWWARPSPGTAILQRHSNDGCVD